MRRRTLVSVLSAAVVMATPYAASAVQAADTPLGGQPTFDGEVFTVQRAGSTLYVGGSFSSVSVNGRTYSRHRLAAIDAASGSVLGWNPDVGGSSVQDIAVRGSNVYAVGTFSSVDGKSRHNVARIGAVSGDVKGFAPRVNDEVDAVAVTKSRVYIGGYFTEVGSKTRRRNAAFARKAPYTLTRWTPKAEGGRVRDIAVRREGVFLAGDFAKVNGHTSARHLALVTKARGGIKSSFHPSAPREVKSIDFSGKRIFAAVGGRGGGRIDAVRRGSGALIWERRIDGDAEAVDKIGGDVFVGGHFDKICTAAAKPGGGTCDGQYASRRKGLSLRASNGAIGSWDPQANGAIGIWTLQGDTRHDKLFVGGAFTAFHKEAQQAPHFAVFRLS